MKYPKIRELREAVVSLVTPAYTSSFPKKPHEPFDINDAVTFFLLSTSTEGQENGCFSYITSPWDPYPPTELALCATSRPSIASAWCEKLSFDILLPL